MSKKYILHTSTIHVVVDLFVYWRPLPYYTYPIISSLLYYITIDSLSSPLLLLSIDVPKPMTFDTQTGDDETHFFE